MFDVSFSELMLVGVIALIVIGPERLPKVARTVGHLLGRAQRYVTEVKSDIQREIDLKEIGDLKNQMQDAAQSVQASMKDSVGDLQTALSDPVDSMKKALDDARDAVGTSAKADAPASGSDITLPTPTEADSAAPVAPAPDTAVDATVSREHPAVSAATSAQPDTVAPEHPDAAKAPSTEKQA